MKRTIFLLALAVSTLIISCKETTTTTTSNTDSPNNAAVTTTTTTTVTTRVPLSETDNYIDLKTGKKMRIKRDPQTNRYVREDMSPLDIYVNEMSRDTFWGPEAVPVNNAIVRDAAGQISVDEMRIQQNGEGYKAKTEDGELKIKDNENEFKTKDGDSKVKVNENEYKMKDEDVKIKGNSRQTKIKTDDSKTKINNRTGEEKTKSR